MKAIKSSDKLIFVILLCALVAGIVTGSFVTAKMPSADGDILQSAIQKAEQARSVNVFFKAMKREGIGALLIYTGGLCVLGAAAAAVYLAWRGYALGFAVGALVRLYGLAGSLSALAGLYFSNFIIIPALLLFGTLGAKNASELSENGIGNTLKQFTLISFVFVVILFAGCLAEGFICTPLMKSTMKMLR